MNILPFIIGSDMPPNDPHYQCFLLLSDISKMLFSKVIANDQIPLLRLLIEEYLETFASLYPHRPLTPKMHYLVHIPTLIQRYKNGSHMNMQILFISLSQHSIGMVH